MQQRVGLVHSLLREEKGGEPLQTFERIMECAGRAERRRRFERTVSVEISNPRGADESGVALRLPPQSKTLSWTAGCAR